MSLVSHPFRITPKPHILSRDSPYQLLQLLTKYLTVSHGVSVIIGKSLALRAGELKKQLRLALPECYVIALVEIINAKSLFKKLEEEMKPVIDELKDSI